MCDSTGADDSTTYDEVNVYEPLFFSGEHTKDELLIVHITADQKRTFCGRDIQSFLTTVPCVAAQEVCKECWSHG